MLLTQTPPSRLTHRPQIDPHEDRRLLMYRRGDQISLENQGIWQVYRGTVQLSTTHVTGEEVMLGWVLPSGYFGQWLTRLEVHEATALSEVYLRWFSLHEVEQSPRLTQEVFKSLAHRVRQSEAMLAIAGQRRVEDRLHQLLTLLKTEMGSQIQGGTRLGVRFTHQNLANAIGTTRVTITRLLGKLQRSGMISFDGDRHLVIHG